MVVIKYLSAVLGAVALAACTQEVSTGSESAGEATKSSVIAIDATSFPELVKVGGGIVVVDYWATWCVPCKTMAPRFEQVASELRDKAVFGKVDVDQVQSLAQEQSILSIPTIIVFMDGEPVERIVGVVSASELAKTVKKYL